eukprot:295077-Rhodomonas_salina.1
MQPSGWPVCSYSDCATLGNDGGRDAVADAVTCRTRLGLPEWRPHVGRDEDGAIQSVQGVSNAARWLVSQP